MQRTEKVNNIVMNKTFKIQAPTLDDESELPGYS